MSVGMEDGELIRGDREILPEEAAVGSVFSSPVSRGIADMLNREGVSGPCGGKRDKPIIHGNPMRGTGILNNALYIGKLVWNRQKFIKDPQTGKPQARSNPESDRIIKVVPELRIIDQSLWDKVKARQEGRKIEQTEREAWERRKPHFLLTGLVKCGCCGGGFSTIGKDRFGCSNSRSKGTSVCTNRTGITRQELEGRILTVLSDHLIDPELVKVFAAEYIAERNRLAATHVDDRAVKEKELAKVIKEQDTVVNALAAGLPPERIKAKMEQLDIRQKQLEQDLAASPAAVSTIRIHPKMADTYHERIRSMIAGLTEPFCKSEAREAIRGLITKIVAVPVPTKGKRMSLELTLHGDLAGILALSLNAELMSGQQKTSLLREVMESVEFLVAGASYRRNLPELRCVV